MKVLVTGAAGFIGFYLVRAMLANGDHVVGIDNINDYYDVNLKYARLEECGIQKEFIRNNTLVQSAAYSPYAFQKMDITDLPSLEALFQEQQFDVVLHMAAQAGVRYSLENPHSYVQSNLVGFVNILECCRHHQIKHLVYASSSSVYGMNDKIPFSEGDRVDHPVSLYAATKKSNELLAHTYSHLYQLPATGLRFFTVYGPWGRPDMAPMLFTDAIYKKNPIKVFNEGNMQRDFTYIADITEGVVKVLSHIPGALDDRPYYRIFNIGNSEPVSLMNFIETLEKATGSRAILKMYPMQAGDVTKTYADISSLQKLTGYTPSTTLQQGIDEFISWFNNYSSVFSIPGLSK